MCKCSIPGCKKLVASITSNDKRKSSIYCSEHSSVVARKCPRCGGTVLIKPKKYVEHVNHNGPIICSTCFFLEVNEGNKFLYTPRYWGIETDDLVTSAAWASYVNDVTSKEVAKDVRVKSFYDTLEGKSEVLKLIRLYETLNKDPEDIYTSKVKVIDTSNFTEVSIEPNKLSEWKNVPGVWASIASTGDVLDVSVSSNIGGDVDFASKALRKGYTNIGKTDEDLASVHKKPDVYIKYRDIAEKEKEIGDGNVSYVAVVSGVEGFIVLKSIELQYAWEHKALCWKPMTLSVEEES